MEAPGELSVSKPLIDATIINNATIANWIMTFAEYYLAYKLTMDLYRNIRILLMDRALSAERAGMKKIRQSKISERFWTRLPCLEKLGWIPFMLAVLKVKSILAKFSFLCSRRIAGEHTHFTTENYKKWLKEASINRLSLAPRRLAQLNQTKAYLFWKKL